MYTFDDYALRNVFPKTQVQEYESNLSRIAARLFIVEGKLIGSHHGSMLNVLQKRTHTIGKDAVLESFLTT